MVIGQNGPRDVPRAAGSSQVAGSRVDRILRIPWIRDSVPVCIETPAFPRARHELHPADRAGRARAHVAAEIRLDFVDRGKHFPGNSVSRARALPERNQLLKVEFLRDRGGCRDRRRRADLAGLVRNQGARQVPGCSRELAESVGAGRARHGHRREGEAQQDTFHCSVDTTRRLGIESSSSGGADCGISSSLVTPAAWRLSACSSATMKSCWLVAALAAVSRSISPETTSSINACSKLCMLKKEPSAIASGISSVLFSRIRSAIRALLTITSMAAIRPPS